MQELTKTQEPERAAKSFKEYPIVGKSRAMESLRKNISRLGKTRNDVLIIGEAGVGK